MSILINQHGLVIGNISSINQLLNPASIGCFTITKEAIDFMHKDLSESTVQTLYNYIPSELKKLCVEKQLIQTNASIFKPSVTQQSDVRGSASQTPHINHGNEIHFIFDGSYIIYFNIKDEHYSLLVQPGDWLYIPSQIEHWIKPTLDQYLVLASYHSEPFDTFHTKVDYTNTKSKAYL